MQKYNLCDLKMFSAISFLNRRRSLVPTKRIKSAISIAVTPVSLMALLGLVSGIWLGQNAIVPQVAQAETARSDISLTRQPDESYETLLRRAEAVARAAAQRSFDGDILVSDVAVTITAENEGVILPVISLQVSRQAWKSRPDTRRWATYLPNAQSLLRIENHTTATAASGNRPDTPTQPAATGKPQQTLPAKPGQPPTAGTGTPGQPPTSGTGTSGQPPTAGNGTSGQSPTSGTGTPGQPPTSGTGTVTPGQPPTSESGTGTSGQPPSGTPQQPPTAKPTLPAGTLIRLPKIPRTLPSSPTPLP